MRNLMLWAFVIGLTASTHAIAAPVPTTEQQAIIEKMKTLLKSLKPQTGDVPIADAGALLKLGNAYYFLPASDAKRVLTEGWGNPPDAVNHVLGMIFPVGKTFLDDGWGAVITYQPSGHVSDEDAQSADYDSLITEMQKGEGAENEERAKAGFPASHLVGWAQPPSYDAKRHVVIWARNIQFIGQDDNTLNYDVRTLGRNGVLSLNMVSSMSKLAATRADAEGLGKAATFAPGSRYADFNPDIDKEAGYGIAGLVAAGVGVVAAKKLGLLAGILLFGKKFLVILLAAGTAIVGWFRKRFGAADPDI